MGTGNLTAGNGYWELSTFSLPTSSFDAFPICLFTSVFFFRTLLHTRKYVFFAKKRRSLVASTPKQAHTPFHIRPVFYFWLDLCCGIGGDCCCCSGGGVRLL
eukprot:RCo003292